VLWIAQRRDYGRGQFDNGRSQLMTTQFKYPLPHTGQRTQVTSHVALITFQNWHVVVLEIKEGNPIPMPSIPKTYTLQSGDLLFYYLLKDSRTERMIERITTETPKASASQAPDSTF
jgi:hypothetical protein